MFRGRGIGASGNAVEQLLDVADRSEHDRLLTPGDCGDQLRNVLPVLADPIRVAAQTRNVGDDSRTGRLSLRVTCCRRCGARRRRGCRTPTELAPCLPAPRSAAGSVETWSRHNRKGLDSFADTTYLCFARQSTSIQSIRDAPKRRSDWSGGLTLSNVRLITAVLAFAGATLCASASAQADCLNGIYDTPLPVSSVSPTDGASLTQASGPVPAGKVQFTLISPLHMASLLVRVSKQDVIGDTGILSDLYQEDGAALAESSTNFGYYSGISNGGSPYWWTNIPGTYYWQAWGTYEDTSTTPETCRAVASPVYTLHITATPVPPPTPTPSPTPTSTPKPPLMTASLAKSLAGKMVTSKTHRHPRLNGTCNRVSSTKASCRLNWTAGGNSYKAAGTIWDYLRSGTAYWWYNFHGTRTSLSCSARPSRSRRCAQSFHWA